MLDRIWYRFCQWHIFSVSIFRRSAIGIITPSFRLQILRYALHLKACPHCRRKLRLSPLSRRYLRQSHFPATVSLFCDSVDRALLVNRHSLEVNGILFLLIYVRKNRRSLRSYRTFGPLFFILLILPPKFSTLPHLNPTTGG